METPLMVSAIFAHLPVVAEGLARFCLGEKVLECLPSRLKPRFFFARMRVFGYFSRQAGLRLPGARGSRRGWVLLGHCDLLKMPNATIIDGLAKRMGAAVPLGR